MVIPALALLLAIAAPPGRAEYDKAARLYAEGDYVRALPWFQKAYARSGRRPSVTFGLAQCERRLGMLDAAEAHLEEFLEAAEPEAKARGRRLLAKVRAEKAQLAAQALRAPPPEEPPAQARPRPAPPPPSASAPKPWEPPTAQVTGPAPDEDGSVLSSPVFWIVTGAVVAAGAVTAGVLATHGGPEPYGGSSGQVFEP